MKIKELFSKDIDRSINGVVKAEQQDDASVWQELDELVVTRELNKHLDKYFGSFHRLLLEKSLPASFFYFKSHVLDKKVKRR